MMAIAALATAPMDTRQGSEDSGAFLRMLDSTLKGETVEGEHAWLFEALSDAVARYKLPHEPLRNLAKARMVTAGPVRFKTYDELTAHVVLASASVGRLSLYLSGYENEEVLVLAGRLSGALYLTQRWLHLAAEARSGQFFVPLVDLESLGGSEADMLAPASSPALRKTLAVMAGRTRTLYKESRALSAKVRFPLNWKIRQVWLTGNFLLNKFGTQNYDPFAGIPTLGPRDRLRIFGLAMLSR